MKKGNNRKRNTILWLVSWAVLFLVVAYSPIGRPDLYVGTSYMVYNQSVNFKGGIGNAPKGKVYSEDLNADMPSPTYSPVGSNNGEFEGNASRFNPSRSSSASSNYNSSSGSESGTGYSSAVMALNSGRSSAQGTATAQNNDVSSLSSELALTSNVESRQAAPPSQAHGGRDPGGKDPKNPIPVGDGMYILISIAGIYALWKMKVRSFFR